MPKTAGSLTGTASGKPKSTREMAAQHAMQPTWQQASPIGAQTKPFATISHQSGKMVGQAGYGSRDS